jgi:alpha-amylase/alpha-mannosidase (GH57 family)
MKYISIFHANLNYAYLVPEKYEFVIRSSYELIFDTMRDYFPDTKYVFEASGYTIEQMAMITPDVIEKLTDAIKRGQCEFMGSPYAHPMLPNFPKEDGAWSIKFSNEIYEKYLGIHPKSFWNPECGWRSYVPEQVAENGYRNLIGDFEAYSRSLGPDGKPNRPEIYEKEHTKTPAFYNFGFHYDLPGHEKHIHFPFENIHGIEKDQLKMFLRTDRVAQFAVRYFMGMEGYSFDAYMELIKKYSAQQPGEPEGALIIFADDAEYVGTNGWFRLKYQNKPDNVFEATPDSKEKLIQFVSECNKFGGFIDFNDACQMQPVPEVLHFDNDTAWHGAQASFWASTPMANLLRPWQDLVREKLMSFDSKLDEKTREKVWYHLTNSYNSDGQWPPTLPDAPHIIHPYNYKYCFENLLAAELLVGGVDRTRLKTDSVKTLEFILSFQQELVLKKAEKILKTGQENEVIQAQKAKALIKKSQNTDSVKAASDKLLYPSEYTIRAEALVEARGLIGGIEIEKV